ncbi:MAG: tRNA (guanosine(46)-N7)-methyltransferase TrmB [Euryarchaeota archaeon]|nr:tRNA (guanosine(46)-N7)-methyltransferase TrmB [Euryarchaeota archaeon]|tara:strand:+ start:356 stop:1039 length:684 start_codon:yes stop_codon:yes gene_type:complete
MGKDKLRKWKENETFDHVFEPNLQDAVKGIDGEMKGKWSEVFKNDNPITLELGCGKGEYTVGLAKKYPNRNFVGVDIKGHRFWRGAKTAQEESIPNVAFLRTRIEFIEKYFDKEEISELWITFSDPQPKDEKGTKRITSPYYIEMYKNILKPSSIINIKSDSVLLYDLSKEGYLEKGYDIQIDSKDVYGELVDRVEKDLRDALEIKTYYEKRWLSEGKKIHFIQLKV